MADLDNILSELDSALDGLNSSLSGNYISQPPPQQQSFKPAPPPQTVKPQPQMRAPQAPQIPQTPQTFIPPQPVQQVETQTSTGTPNLQRQSSKTEQLQKQLEEIRARKEARQTQGPMAPVNPQPVASEGEWKQATTATGRVYYYNTKTKATSWQRPEGFADSSSLSSSSSPSPSPSPSSPTPVPQQQQQQGNINNNNMNGSKGIPAQHPVSPPPQSSPLSPSMGRNASNANSNPQKSFEIPRPGSAPSTPTPQVISSSQPPKPALSQTIPLPGKTPIPQPQQQPQPIARPVPTVVPINPTPIPQPKVIPIRTNPAPLQTANTLESQPWYFGNISRTETETILKNSKKNGFLIRDSSQPGCYAASMIDCVKMQVHHTLIVKSPTGYHFEEQPEFGEFPDVISLVKNTSLLQQFSPISKN